MTIHPKFIALVVRGGADRCDESLERALGPTIADIRMQHHVARGKLRQLEPRAHIDRPGLSAATARPAETAAPVVAMPPPTKTSVQAMPAAFSASIAVLRTLQGSACVA